MYTNSQALVSRFIENRDAIRAVFRMESEYIYPVCAHIFLAADRPVEAERLEQCKALVKSSTGVFSSFRGNIKLPLVCMLATVDDPEERWSRTQRCYALLKEEFFSSEYLALAALLLSDTVPEDAVPALAARGKALYKRMQKAHPFLTGQEDSVFALLLGQSDRTDDELMEDMEACYELLDQRFPKGDGLQTASHVLALSTAAPEEKAERMIALFDAILAAGIKYGKDQQLAILAALSLGQESVDELVRGMGDLDAELAEQKGYRGFFGLDKRTRSMHDAMLLSLPDKGDGQQAVVRAAAQKSALAIIAAQQALMCAVVASSAASSAAASTASH